jgi:hypothetical protein
VRHLFAPPYQLAILRALGLKPEGSVYAGTARERPLPRRLAAAKSRRKQARREGVAARAAWARAHSEPFSRGGA